MRKLKKTLFWVLVVAICFFILDCGGKVEQRKREVCEDKGMILLQGRGPDYCAYGTREGL